MQAQLLGLEGTVGCMPLPVPLPAPRGDWEPGLLTLPASLVSDRLNVRAEWAHIETKLADRAHVESQVRKVVADIDGTPDDVIADMVIRHVRCSHGLVQCTRELSMLHTYFCAPPCSQFDRCKPEQDLRSVELAHLLGILVGAEQATRLTRAVLNVVEEGRPISWYEKNLRKKYGG